MRQYEGAVEHASNAQRVSQRVHLPRHELVIRAQAHRPFHRLVPHDVAKRLWPKPVVGILAAARHRRLAHDVLAAVARLARHRIGRRARRHKGEVLALGVVARLVQRPQLRLEEAPPLPRVAILGKRGVDGDAISRLARLLHMER